MLERTYAAVRFGDDTMSILWSSGSGVVVGNYEIALSIDSGEPTFLAGDGMATDGRQSFSAAFVDDRDMLVGSTVMSVREVLLGTVASALGRVGALGPVDLLEIACPSAWGPVRHATLREALRSLAREVVVVDTATATVRSIGERAPESAVVVEVNDVDSVVCRVEAMSATPIVSGLWDAVGRVDLAVGDGSEASIVDRVERAVEELAGHRGRGPVDVFVPDAVPALRDLSFGDSCRVRFVRNADVVRSMASRVGVALDAEPVVVAPVAAAHTESYVDPSRLLPPPAPQRATAWLDDVTRESSPPRSRLPIVGGVCAAVVLVAVAAVLWLRPDAVPADSQTRAETTAVPRSPVPTTSEPPASTITPKPEFTDFAFGRVQVRLPATWSARDDGDRLLLVPSDEPDRRIVLTTTELTPGASMEDVAADLAAQLGSREGFPPVNVERIGPSTDFGARTGLFYVETPGDDSVVRWHVFVESGLQISIGCQSRMGDERILERDCAHAVDTLVVAPDG